MSGIPADGISTADVLKLNVCVTPRLRQYLHLYIQVFECIVHFFGTSRWRVKKAGCYCRLGKNQKHRSMHMA